MLQLDFSPSNHPVVIFLDPRVGAIAAGCPAVVKPSEISANAANALTDLIPKYLDPNAYAVVTGAVARDHLPPIAQVGFHPFHRRLCNRQGRRCSGRETHHPLCSGARQSVTGSDCGRRPGSGCKTNPLGVSNPHSSSIPCRVLND